MRSVNTCCVQGGTCLSCQWMQGWGSCWCWGRPWAASPPASLWRPASPTGPLLPAARTSKTLQAVCAKPWLLQVPCLPSPPLPSQAFFALVLHAPGLYEFACMFLNICWCACACLPRNKHPLIFCSWVQSCGRSVRQGTLVSSIRKTLQAQAAVVYLHGCCYLSEQPWLLQSGAICVALMKCLLAKQDAHKKCYCTTRFT